MEDVKVTPFEAVKNLIKKINVAVAIFFMALGVVIFLGVVFYNGIKTLSVHQQVIEQHQQAITDIVNYIKTNVPQKQ